MRGLWGRGGGPRGRDSWGRGRGGEVEVKEVGDKQGGGGGGGGEGDGAK